MNNADFERECNALIDDATKNIMKSKGREYAGNEDRLANFKRGAHNVGVNPETVLFIYLSKHWDSISTFIRDLEKEKSYGAVACKLSEPIQERLKDALNYILLLNGLLMERKHHEDNINERKM